MRILICSTDGIGDLVLREPLLRALEEERHELMILVRDFSVKLARQIVADARIVAVFENPYEMTVQNRMDFSPAIAAAVREFGPELLVFPAFQTTNLEQFVAGCMPGVKRAGFRGVAYSAVTGASANASSIALDVEVVIAEDSPEVAKNARLLDALLGRAAVPRDPVLKASPRQLDVAKAFLRGNGIASGEFWVAVVGHTHGAFSEMKNLDLATWSVALDHLAERWGRRIVLAGSMDEVASLESLRTLMRQKASAYVAGGSGKELDLVIGLLALSRGYLGKDGGPMHLAAALDRPVVAAFGGGHWPRFLPSANRSCILTVGMPCVGCRWICRFHELYCVKRIPAVEITKALDRMEADLVTGREIKVIEPGYPLDQPTHDGVRSIIPVRVGFNTEAKTVDGVSRAEPVEALKAELAALKAAYAIEVAAAESRERGAHSSQDSSAPLPEEEVRRRDLHRLALENRRAQQHQELIRDLRRSELQRADMALELQNHRRAELLLSGCCDELKKELQIARQAGVAREMEVEELRARMATYDREQAERNRIRTEQEIQRNLQHRAAAEEIESLRQRWHQAEVELQKMAQEMSLHRDHARELATARSRRLLLKMKLVSRCHWEGQ